MLEQGQTALAQQAAFSWMMNFELEWEMEIVIAMIGCSFNFRKAQAIPTVAM